MTTVNNEKIIQRLVECFLISMPTHPLSVIDEIELHLAEIKCQKSYHQL